MAYYDALKTQWAKLAPDTTANKLAAINAQSAQSAAQGVAMVTPSQILNAIVSADFLALTQLQVSQLTLLLSGGSVDASKGSSIRGGIQSFFSGKTQTLANLTTLFSAADQPVTIPWWQSNGYPRAFDQGDLTQAGLS